MLKSKIGHHMWAQKQVKAFLLFSQAFVLTFSVEATDPGSLFMELERRVGDLESTIQELTGKVEELQHALRSARPVDSVPSESSLPSPEGISSGSSGPAPVSSTSRSVPFGKARGSDSAVGTEPLRSGEEGRKDSEPLTEQQAYDRARLLLNRGSYEKAEAAFKSFISSFEKSPLVVNAQYWLGETYYGRQDYERSSVAFMEAYKTYRVQLKSGAKANRFAKAPESLIKLVMSLKGLGKKQNACVTYKELRKQFPKLHSNLERLAQQSVEGLPCQ